MGGRQGARKPHKPDEIESGGGYNKKGPKKKETRRKGPGASNLVDVEASGKEGKVSGFVIG